MTLHMCSMGLPTGLQGQAGLTTRCRGTDPLYRPLPCSWQALLIYHSILPHRILTLPQHPPQTRPPGSQHQQSGLADGMGWGLPSQASPSILSSQILGLHCPVW